MADTPIKITIPPAIGADGKPLTNKAGEPVPPFSGRRVGIMFDRGVGTSYEPLNDGQRMFFQRKGYKVEGDTPPKIAPNPDAEPDATKPPVKPDKEAK